MGAGPAAGLECLQCPDFDPAYACKMFAQYGTIIALTEYGAKRATDSNLRAISREINGYLKSANGKLQAWYGAMSCNAQCALDCGRAEAIINQLSQNCNCFDGAYAATLSELLKQSNCAEQLGGSQAVTAPMRQQAQFLTARTADWTMRLDRWISEHGQTA